jgi:DNA-directed RNA polymerase specialized sigma subunit
MAQRHENGRHISEQPEDYHRYAKALEELGDKCRQLLSLYYYEHRSWEEISGMLGYTTAANARNQKYKCLEQVRKKVLSGNE